MDIVKEIIESIKVPLPESAIRINNILKELLDEIELMVGYFISEGYLPEKLDNIYEEISNVKEEIGLGYGQLDLLEDGRDEDDEKDGNYKLDTSLEHSLLENFTHIRPYGFKFLNDEIIEVKTWKSLYIEACKIFIDLDETLFLSFINKTNMNGQKKNYFSKEKTNIDFPAKIKDKLYISTKFDANGIRDLLIKILKEYDYDAKKFKIYFRLDYNPKHRPKGYVTLDDMLV